MPHLSFKSESGLSKFLRRDLSRPLGRSANDGGSLASLEREATENDEKS